MDMDVSTILIVDDQLSVRDTLEALLAAPDYRLEVASTGAQALALAADLMPDVILLDVMMPVMDGFEACRRLRADPRLAEVPVVMVTALDDHDSRLRGINAGADDFVTKPFDHIELRARVRTITRLNRYRRLLIERRRREQAEEHVYQLYQELERRAKSLEQDVAHRTAELRAERDRTQAILEALGEAVIVTDTQGNIQYLNPAAAELTGFGSQEAAGQNWRLWQSASQPDDFYARIQESALQGRTWRGEARHRRKDGALYDAALTVAPLYTLDILHSEPGAVAGFVCVQRDITPLKEAERLKDQFVSNVSHELRTPLSLITFASGNLDAFYERMDEDKRRQTVRDIRRHAQTLDELIGSILEVSRIDSRRISDERQRVNLAQLAKEEAAQQLAMAHRKKQSLSVTGDESLPVWGNESQLRRIIRNLLNNAIKYTPQGGQITCECIRSTESQGSRQWVALRVADTGIGIEAEHLPHVFERFYRVQEQGNIPGTGLGLSIAKDLVELHGGRITADSIPGQGSVFTIYLPLLEEAPHG